MKIAAPIDLVDRIDVLEAKLYAMGAQPPQKGSVQHAEFPVTHKFTPGMYIREIFMPAGSAVVSKIHKTEHPFTISKGRCLVYSENTGPMELCAPYTGVTKPGTRRVLYMLEDTVWTTYHPTELSDVDEIEAEIIEPRLNMLLIAGAIARICA